MTLTITVNGTPHEVAADAETPLLYVLRNDLKLKGTRFGCGTGLCGACMVIIDGKAVQSCDVSVSAVAGKSVTTIEALGNIENPHPLQQAFIAEQAAQCGYCASGIIMSAKALLDANPSPATPRSGRRSRATCAAAARTIASCAPSGVWSGRRHERSCFFAPQAAGQPRE